MYGKTQRILIQEDIDCITNWENYVLLERLPHELGITAEPYLEDIEAIKTMKKWMQKKDEKENKKEKAKAYMREKMRRERAGLLPLPPAAATTSSNS